MTDPGPRRADDPLREPRAVMLLSLDVTRPFLGEMGLAVRGELPWTDAMRAYVREYRAAFHAAPPPVPPGRLPDLIAFTRARLGEEAARVLRWWLDRVYAEAPGEHPEYRAWEDVFRHARRRPEAWATMELPPSLAEPARAHFIDAIDPDRLEPVWEEVRAAPLSDWDLHLYAINGWNDDLPDAPNGPESAIHLVTRDWKNLQYWHWLATQLAPEARERVQRGAQRLVDSTPALSTVGALPPLASLVLELP
jgi:hypothetical protein